MSSNDEDVRICPYGYCRAFVTLLVERVSPDNHNLRKVVPLHNIEHPQLEGPCPASRQPVGFYPDIPPSFAVQTMLLEREAADRARIPKLVAEQVNHQYHEMIDPPKRGESQSLRGPHRMGREPVTEADQDAWQIGGREDEESGKVTPLTGAPSTPTYVQGERYGHHMSVSDNVTLLQNANIRAGNAMTNAQEALSALQSATEDLGEAASDVAQVMGDSAAESLQVIFRLLQQAQQEVEASVHSVHQVPGTLATARDQIEQRIAAFLA